MLKNILLALLWIAIFLSVMVPALLTLTRRPRDPRRSVGKHPGLGMPYASGGFVPGAIDPATIYERWNHPRMVTPPGLLTSYNRRCTGIDDCPRRFPCDKCEIIK